MPNLLSFRFIDLCAIKVILFRCEGTGQSNCHIFPLPGHTKLNTYIGMEQQNKQHKLTEFLLVYI